MKNKLNILCIILLAVFMLAGCGGNTRHSMNVDMAQKAMFISGGDTSVELHKNGHIESIQNKQCN